MTPADVAVEHHFVDLPGLRMHTVSAGPVNGPLVLLLHGFPENWWSFRYQIAPLAQAGLRVVAPDLRGYGATDKKGPYDLSTLAGDVCHLLTSLGGEPRARIVGHDWGGAVAWHMASTRPEFVERLAVLNCPHPAVLRDVMAKQFNWRQIKKSWYMFAFLLPWLPEWFLTKNDAGEIVRMLRANAIDRAHFSAEELRPFRDAIQGKGAAHAMLGWYRTALLDGVFKKAPPPARVDCEALLIWGMRDAALGFDDTVPGTQALAPKLQIERVETAGHFVHAEAPDLVNARLLSFLRP